MDAGTLGRVRPLYFMHIPKTGGASLTEAIARLFPAGQVAISADGNLTLADLGRLGSRLDGPLFLAGHPTAGVARALTGRADIITMLRRPRDHAVSNYLHVLSDPENPFHASATRQSFADFLRENPGLAAYQANALGFVLSDDGASRVEPEPVLEFLDSLAFAGVTDRPDACAEALTYLIGGERPVEIPCLNAAVYRGVSAATLVELGRAYEALRDDPRLTDLMAMEDAVYQRAVTRLERLLEARPARPRAPGFIASWRFRDQQGPLLEETPRRALSKSPDHLVYGPFERLPRGHFAAAFHLEIEGSGAGRVEIEVLANGRTCLRRRWRPARAGLPQARLTLAFFNPAALNVLEFRVRAKGCPSGELVFRGVTIRPSGPLATWPSVVARFGGAMIRPNGLSAPDGRVRPARP